MNKEAIHYRAMRRFDHIWEVERKEREQSLRDRRLAVVRGAWWEGEFRVGDDDCEDDAGPPRMEVLKCRRQIIRTAGEYRSSRQTVDFRPDDDDSDRASADNLDGLYRADLRDSVGGGQLAVDNAAEESRHGGRGAWRYRAAWEDDEDEANEHQRIRVERIDDADQCVFFDLDAKAQDKSDARFGFVLFDLTRDAFEEQHPDASAVTFSQKNPWQYDWTRPDSITLAEYYEIEDKSVLRRTFRQTALDGAELPEEMEPDEQTHDDKALTEVRDDGSTLEDDLRKQGYTQVRSRKIKRQRVHKYLLSGSEVLADEGLIAGKYIPVIPLYYKRAMVEGIERAEGMIRPVIDSQRLYNLMVSGLAEAAAGPVEDTPIVAPEQVEGNIALIWAARKTQRPAYLPLNPLLNPADGSILSAGPVGSLPVAPVSPNMAALIQTAGADIAEIMGANDRPEQVPSNTSAEAIELVNNEGDIADYEWKDNLSIALEHAGRVWLSMAQELYVEQGRKMPAIGPNGEKSVVKLAEPASDEGGQYLKNDLTSGKYRVIVDVGPATKSKRDATVKSMVGIGQAYGAAGNMDASNACYGIAVLNMDGEGIDGIQAWTRKQGLQGGWVEPNEQEKEAMANQQPAPDPNLIAAQAQQTLAQAEVLKAQAAAAAEETKRLTAEANAQAQAAKTAAILAGIPLAERAQILDEVKAAIDVEHKDKEHTLSVIDATQQVEQHDKAMREQPNDDGA